MVEAYDAVVNSATTHGDQRVINWMQAVNGAFNKILNESTVTASDIEFIEPSSYLKPTTEGNQDESYSLLENSTPAPVNTNQGTTKPMQNNCAPTVNPFMMAYDPFAIMKQITINNIQITFNNNMRRLNNTLAYNCNYNTPMQYTPNYANRYHQMMYNKHYNDINTILGY